MKIEDIIQTHDLLARQLKNALSTMNKKDEIPIIHQKILENQSHCPHFDSNYNWAIVNETCPYCGKHLATGGYVKNMIWSD